MKTLSAIQYILGIVLLSCPTLAMRRGGISDGGGNAVVCRNPQGEIQSAVLLDLFEAEKVYKLRIQKNEQQKGYLQLADEAAKRIDQGGAAGEVTSLTVREVVETKVKDYFFGLRPLMTKDSVQTRVRNIHTSLSFISGAGLSPIDDYTTIIAPKNCLIEQTAVYLDVSKDIYVVEEIWNAFDDVNKAALLVHEAMYKEMRGAGDINSDRTRLAVGQAFAGAVFRDIMEGVPDTVTICGTDLGQPKYRFAVIENNPQSVTLQFFWMHDKIMLSKTKITVPLSFSPASGLAQDSSTMMVDLQDSLLEKGITLALDKKRDAFGVIVSSIGVVTNEISEKTLFKLSCNKASFECGPNHCSGTIHHNR